MDYFNVGILYYDHDEKELYNVYYIFFYIMTIKICIKDFKKFSSLNKYN